MTSPLSEALARLREEVRLAEEHLARLDNDDAPLGERLALAGDAHVARLRVAEVERGLPGAAQQHRAAAFTEALSGLFADDTEEPSTDKPDDGEHPLAGLFA